MKIATSSLKDAVTKSIKGVNNNNNLPLTSLIGIKLSGGKLRFLSTDMVNKLCVIVDKVAGDDIDITVSAELFSKLISKLTCESVEMTVTDDVLVVRGNGTYKIPLIADENGLVSFPDIDYPAEDVEGYGVKLTSIMNVYNINSASLSKDLDNPCLTGYYCSDRVVSTNGSILTSNNIELFGKMSLLVSPQMMYLLTLNDSEDIKFYNDNGRLYFITDTVVVCGSELAGKEDYPVEAIAEYFSTEFPSTCKVPRELMLSVLDRLALFIESYDHNCATFTFGRTGIIIKSNKGSSEEVIRYVASENFADFSCIVNIPAIRQLIKANPSDTLTFKYGDDSVLELVEGNVSQIVALGDDDDTDYGDE